MCRQDADGIGAKPDEGGMAERDQRAAADQEIERHRCNSEDHHPPAQAEQMLAPEVRGDREQRKQQEDADRQELRRACASA